MILDENQLTMLVDAAMQNLRSSPKNLENAINFVADSNDINITSPLDIIVRHLQNAGPNDRIRHIITLKLKKWEHEEEPEWGMSTIPHSQERRDLILSQLGFGSNEKKVINEAVPIYSETHVPIVIAKEHEKWYEKRKSKITSFYWEHYKKQLAPPIGKWNSDSIAALELSTDDVISRLSDPCASEIYPVKGLVMGYVQSGKTSHFSGLIAKAADAGYRLIIVLAGTMEILREQTQRRIDKEIVGKELLGSDEYGSDVDWRYFVEHEGRPSDLGFFDWDRLTNKNDDYNSLLQHLKVLEFRAINPNKPFNHPDNIRNAPAKLAVIKKIPSRIEKLTHDLSRLGQLRSVLEHVPTLVIDDESDQASVNTITQKQTGSAQRRTSTNKAIGDLLKMLPRAQYVGYTATPFANVFIDPDDAEDLFPKDFIVSLPRPEGYMGVSDFYDFDGVYDKNDFRSNKEAYVREVDGYDSEPDNLEKAVDSFILSGAIKLFRENKDPGEYYFQHHTMLVHKSPRKVVHDDDADEVLNIFKGGARYQHKEGLVKLKKLFNEDFYPVSKVKEKGELFPENFEELEKYISQCISKVCDEKPVLIVNGDNKDDTPDFDQKPVWAILVGGTKLSRGYTVEGLTISYYRRPAGAADTLMQMGRWFGFRNGYRDLVRLYIGVNEPQRKQNKDLYALFGAVCQDEEKLRKELSRYKDGGLTPEQVPPLVHQHLPHLPPTSRNKMFNARIKSKDYSGDWTEKASAPKEITAKKHNLRIFDNLVNNAKFNELLKFNLVNERGVSRNFNGYLGLADAKDVIQFLSDYIWPDDKKLMEIELEFIKEKLKMGKLKKWKILLPQIKTMALYNNCNLSDLAIIERKRITPTRFGVYSDPGHRDVAEYLTYVSEAITVSGTLARLRDEDQPVLVLYLANNADKHESVISIGFGIQYPGKKLNNAITWTVADRKNKDAVVIPLQK